MSFERVCVVGGGLIGGSVARRLAALGRDVVVVDPDAATRAQASAAGLAATDTVPADRDLVVLSTPLDVLPAVMAQVAAAAPQATVVDLGSVKQAPAAAAAAAGLSGRYVGLHPMAGTEHTGFEHSEAGLLVGASWAAVHDPEPGSTAPVAQVVDWVIDVFEATVVVLDAAAHDRSVALVSHAPHAVAHALLATTEVSPDAGVARWLAAGSFRDGTRVAGRNAERTGNMLVENAAALAPVLDDVIAELSALRSDLADPAALRARLARAVEDAGAVRGDESGFEPCPSLHAALTGGRHAGTALVVRRRAGALETAPASTQGEPR